MNYYPQNFESLSRKRRISRHKRRHFRRMLSCAMLSLCLLLFTLCAGFLICGVRINSDPPVVREYLIESDKISSPVTFVMLSDLHGCEHGDANSALIDAIEEIAPDAILMCGDMINHREDSGEDLLVTCALIGELTDIAPVYFSYGNHERERIDFYDRDADDHIENAGAVILECEYVDLDIRGQRIRLGGLYTPNSAETKKPDASSVEGFLSDLCESDSFLLLLEHRPHSFANSIYPLGYSPDLVLSGHLHGGHVVLPFFGPVYGSNYGIFPDYALGEYIIGESTMIVSAGLSTDRHIIPRINNPPEITKITID